MSKINFLRIENFKCFRDLRVNFKNITVLAGGNACGKSSVIQIFRYINQLYERDGQWNINTKLNNQDLGTARNLISNFADDERDARIKVLISIKDESDDFNLELYPDPSDDYRLAVKGEKLAELHTAINLYALSADRCAPKTVHEIGDVANWFVGSNGEYSISLFNHLNILSKDVESKEYTIDNLSDELRIRGGKHVRSFDQLCDMWITSILGHTQIYASKIEDVPFNKLLIRNHAGDCVPAATGFGISYCLPIVIQGLAAAIKNDGVLIVENPEAHLHPFGQSKMGQFLALLSLSGIQVIIETHSEHIINGIRLIYGNNKNYKNANIIFFNNIKEYSQEEITINNVGELSKWPQGFFDQTEIDVRELLKRKYNGDKD